MIMILLAAGLVALVLGAELLRRQCAGRAGRPDRALGPGARVGHRSGESLRRHRGGRRLEAAPCG